MCSPGNKTPTQPDLPQYDWEEGDPMHSIPTHLRPNSMPEDNLRCSACGQVASQDELTSFGGKHGYPFPALNEDGTQAIDPKTKQKLWKSGCPPIRQDGTQRKYKHKTKNPVDRPPVKIIFIKPDAIKAPSL